MSIEQLIKNGAKYVSLNPCCNGIYSMRAYQMLDKLAMGVLILVVMEYTQ